MTGVAQSWLDIQCGIIPGVTRAVVIRQDTVNGRLKSSAIWPAEMKKIPEELLAAVLQANDRGTAVVRNTARNEDDGQFSCIVAAPLSNEKEDLGVAAVEISGKDSIKSQDVLRFLRWGGVWLNLLDSEASNDQQSSRLTTLVEILVGSLEHEHFQVAANKAVTDLAGRLDCERVSLGLLKNRRIHIKAISHSAHIDHRSNLIREISSAMEEAIDQDATVSYPALINSVPQVSFAQEVLHNRNEGRSVCTTPLFNNGKAIGAITFEMNAGTELDKPTMELFESLGALLGPVLELKYQNDRLFIAKLWDSGWRILKQIFGFRYFIFKLMLIAIAAGITYTTITTADYRVRAPATLEPKSKQVITAPQQGYIVSINARAGDRVEQDALLATLDEREIQLERLRLKSEFEQYMMERRAGLLDESERAKVAIAGAQIKQAEARMRLLNEQLKRTKIKAPFDGIIVSGDLDQALGTPLERGQVLFEIAPVNSYRLRVDVEERDIGDIQIGYQGELLLTGLPDQSVPFKVERLLPVSDAKEGKNMFQIEASIDTDNPMFRPGMEGIAKIDVDQRPIISIWFRKLLHWCRLQSWYWLG